MRLRSHFILTLAISFFYLLILGGVSAAEAWYLRHTADEEQPLVINSNRPMAKGILFIRAGEPATVGNKGNVEVLLDTAGAQVDRASFKLEFPSNLLKPTKLSFLNTNCNPSSQEINSSTIDVSCLINQSPTKAQIISLVSVEYLSLKSGGALLSLPLQSSEASEKDESILFTTNDYLLNIP